MRYRNETGLSALCAGGLWLLAGGAFAQNNPELGDVGAQAQVQTQQPAPTVETTTTTTTAADSSSNRFAGTDHGSVVGHFGAGWFGLMNIPVAGNNGMNNPDFGDDQFILAPTIGVRWWMLDWLGIEAGLGIGIESGGTHFEDDMGSADTNDPSITAFGIHGGVPMVVAASKHFAFEVVPEMNFGFATGGRDDESMANADVDLSGYVFELGARAGAEIQFGFIDIPQLALQASLGLHLRIENRGHTVGDETANNTHIRFGTSVIGEPWDIFTGNIAAIYYF
ncbi:MAG TPA: hypothetical protein VJV78_23040 [Polyangiales bacterium]|nr:hypothetical protein [Polyangiales bacterium]